MLKLLPVEMRCLKQNPLIMVFAIIYFMIYDRSKSVNVSMKLWSMPLRAEMVITQGGLVGKVAKVGDDELEVDFAENARIGREIHVISVRGND